MGAEFQEQTGWYRSQTLVSNEYKWKIRGDELSEINTK